MIVGGVILIVLGCMALAFGVMLNRNMWVQLYSVLRFGTIDPGDALIVLGGLMLTGGIVLVVCGCRKQERQPPAYPVPPTAPGSYASGVGPTDYAPGPAVPAPVRAVPAQADNGFRLQCLLGAFAGKRFPINGTVRIGREGGKCDLAFPASAAGISRIHCELTVQGNEVILRDLGSTYGTFVEGGRRLAAHEPVRLQFGSKFWLGNENQLFVIAPKGGL